MDTFRVSFWGHRKIDDIFFIEKSLEKMICTLLQQHTYVEFLVGREGEFDQLVSSTIPRCKRTVRNDNSAHIWVMPYVTVEYQENEESFQNHIDRKILVKEKHDVISVDVRRTVESSYGWHNIASDYLLVFRTGIKNND